MTLDIYLNFGGNCGEAFAFYVEHLGASLLSLTTHGEMGDPKTPAEWREKVLHARIRLGGTVVMGADIPPDRFKPMRSAYLTLRLDGTPETERVYRLLTEGGEIFMKMEETFYAHRFAMLRDRFGTSWMLLHEKAPA